MEKSCFYDQNGEKFRKEFTIFFDHYVMIIKATLQKNENYNGRQLGENIINGTTKTIQNSILTLKKKSEITSPLFLEATER